ncbi:MAG: patatin-like phospholipase family protein [Bacilli bacterium]|nr:patatin-like phospholipase family protein [Bacilli bacterium]
MKYGLVLAGGGTKGSYQVGALIALKEMKINIGAVSGSSIGSINAALFVQGDTMLLRDLYSNIEMHDILKLSDKNALKNTDTLLSKDNVKSMIKEYIDNKGISNEPLRNLLNKYVDIDKIYKSKIDFGLMTFDLEKKEGLDLFKEDIPRDKFIDYLLASSCFPVFKPQTIGNKKFLDGGLYDNIPINMVTKRGYKKIIIIDLSGVGFFKRSIDKDAYIKVIKPKEDLGSVFEFDKKLINRNIYYGYLDTLKAFNKLMGERFYFKPNEYFKLLKRYGVSNTLNLEEAGVIYKLDKFKIWKADEFIETVLSNYKRERKEYDKVKASKPNLKNIKAILNKGLGVSLCMDINNNYPMILNTYGGLFSNYIKVSKIIDEIISNE